MLTLESLDKRVTDCELELASVKKDANRYKDASSAFHEAKNVLERLKAEHASEHVSMLQSAKNILDGAVSTAVAPFAEPLAVVKRIRLAQKRRHTRERFLAEQEAERTRLFRVWVKRIAAVMGVLFSMAEVYRALKG